MTSLQRLLKTNDKNINAVNAIEAILVKEMVDSLPLKDIVPDVARYSAIADDLGAYCEVNDIDEKLLQVAISKLQRNKKDYKDIPEEEFNMLFKLKVVK